MELNVINFHIHALLNKRVTKDLLSLVRLTLLNLPRLKCSILGQIGRFILSQTPGLFNKPVTNASYVYARVLF